MNGDSMPAMKTPSLSWQVKFVQRLKHPAFWQGVLGIMSFLAVWQLARQIGWLVVMPSPIEVVKGIPKRVSRPDYWVSWLSSGQRVFLGFFIAALVAVALGVFMGTWKKFRDMWFPILEIFRPIPPLAWLPLAILFWPSPELTMIFLTFMGAFFPILINVISGIDNIDARYIQAAMSLGSSQRALFWRILVPGALPSLFTGLAIAIGITWEVVIAAEMASGNQGLGYLTWDAYMSQSFVGIVIGMVSIGIAGMISSWLMRWFGTIAMPWRENW